MIKNNKENVTCCQIRKNHLKSILIISFICILVAFFVTETNRNYRIAFINNLQTIVTRQPSLKKSNESQIKINELEQEIEDLKIKINTMHKNNKMLSNIYNKTQLKYSKLLKNNNNIDTSTMNNPDQTAKSYLTELLFNNDMNLSEYFSESDTYVPLYNLDNFRRSRAVVGDVTRLRVLLQKIIETKECINVVAIGGSVTWGRPFGEEHAYPVHFEHWLNQFYPCQNGKHLVVNQATPGSGPSYHFGALLDKVKYQKDIGTKYDLIIMETSTNYGGSSRDSWSELNIRNLFLLENEPCIIYLQATLDQDEIINTGGTNERNDLEQLINLHYYQIPTVSLSHIIYPLAYRYYLNGYMHPNDTNFSKVLAQYHPYLFDIKNINVEQNNKFDNFSTSAYYHDIRYSFEAFGHHLREDKVHPSIGGQKYLALLLGYMFVTEYNNMLFDMNHNANEFELYHANKLWLHPVHNALPPILFMDSEKYRMNRGQTEFYLQFANKLLDRRSIVFNKGPLFRAKTWVWDYRKTGKITQNHGPFEMSDEHNKIGFICSEPITCKLTISINALYSDLNPCFDSQSLAINIVYLKSYENMGAFKLWIDDKTTINNYTIAHQKNATIMDGLQHHHTSAQISTAFQHVCEDEDKLKEQKLYFHIMVVKSTPPRKVNKFKLLQVYFIKIQ